MVKRLLEVGYISDGGTNHEHFIKEGRTVLVPRHQEIPDQAAKRILRQAGLR